MGGTRGRRPSPISPTAFTNVWSPAFPRLVDEEVVPGPSGFAPVTFTSRAMQAENPQDPLRALFIGNSSGPSVPPLPQTGAGSLPAPLDIAGALPSVAEIALPPIAASGPVGAIPAPGGSVGQPSRESTSLRKPSRFGQVSRTGSER